MSRLLKLLILFTSFFTFTFSVCYAADWEKFEDMNIDIGEDKYIHFDTPEDVSRKEEFGIELDVDEGSRSAQWINLYFSVPSEVFTEGKVDKFLILANGKWVDTVYVQYTQKDGKPIERGWYEVKPSIPELIGTEVAFQVIGVQEHENRDIRNFYAVAWSEQSDMVKMDPLPVKDDEAISVLYSILAKLQEKLSETNGLLNRLNKEIETLFTPSEQAKQNLASATSNLENKLPHKQLETDLNNIKDTFTNSTGKLSKPLSKLKFGQKDDWFHIGQEYYLFDFTSLANEVRMFRKMLQIVIWIEFFTFIIFYLLPKLKL